jgi:hypothetical protein
MLGLILKDDDGFLQVLELKGTRIEEMQSHAKACNLGKAKP